MRLIHLSDLHIGKRVNEFSMIEDQKYILKEIINIIDDEKPDGVMIAGDIYDRTTPGEDAVRVLSSFLSDLARRKIEVYIISGNHDSAAKLSFASELINPSGIHIAPEYDGVVTPYVLNNGKLKVNIYMLPFVKPLLVKKAFPEMSESINDYTDAMKVSIDNMDINEDDCNILIAHQLVMGAVRSDSEEISVGGLDNVDASVFEKFDYVALGHIHGPQRMTRDTIRYSGTPLKYSFSEARHNKSVTVIDIDDSKKVNIREIKLIPLRDMREIKGTYNEITCKDNYKGSALEDYVHIILTDEEDIPNAMNKLRIIYPNLMKLTYDNKRTRENKVISDTVDIENKSPIELFEEFYELQNNNQLNEEQKNYMTELIDSIWEEH